MPERTCVYCDGEHSTIEHSFVRDRQQPATPPSAELCKCGHACERGRLADIAESSSANRQGC